MVAFDVARQQRHGRPGVDGRVHFKSEWIGHVPEGPTERPIGGRWEADTRDISGLDDIAEHDAADHVADATLFGHNPV
jgi:hypothetical protein